MIRPGTLGVRARDVVAAELRDRPELSLAATGERRGLRHHDGLEPADAALGRDRGRGGSRAGPREGAVLPGRARLDPSSGVHAPHAPTTPAVRAQGTVADADQAAAARARCGAVATP